MKVPVGFIPFFIPFLGYLRYLEITLNLFSCATAIYFFSFDGTMTALLLDACSVQTPCMNSGSGEQD